MPTDSSIGLRRGVSRDPTGAFPHCCGIPACGPAVRAFCDDPRLALLVLICDRSWIDGPSGPPGSFDGSALDRPEGI